MIPNEIQKGFAHWSWQSEFAFGHFVLWSMNDHRSTVSWHSRAEVCAKYLSAKLIIFGRRTPSERRRRERENSWFMSLQTPKMACFFFRWKVHYFWHFWWKIQLFVFHIFSAHEIIILLPQNYPNSRLHSYAHNLLYRTKCRTTFFSLWYVMVFTRARHPFLLRFGSERSVSISKLSEEKEKEKKNAEKLATAIVLKYHFFIFIVLRIHDGFCSYLVL